MKTTKKLILVFLCLALAVAAIPMAIHAVETAGPNVYIAVDKTAAYVGDTITVTFGCNDVTLNTLTGGIKFDTEYLTCTSATLAPANGHGLLTPYLTGDTDFRMVGLSTVEEANDAGQVGFYSIGTQTQSFTGTLLFTATFEVLKAGAINIVAYEDSYEGSNNESVQTITVTAAEAPQNVSVVYKGSALASAYTVSGQVVTVTHTAACKVGYWSETDGKYIAISAVANTDGSYSFTAPDGVTEVLLVVKGDVNGNGSVNALDKNNIGKSLLDKSNTKYKPLEEAWQIFAADVNGNGSVNALDKNNVGKSLLDKSNDKYKALSW